MERCIRGVIEYMKKIIVIGCPGSGKSTFSRKLNEITHIPIYYLDMIYHRPDKTVVGDKEFDDKLNIILNKEQWIVDGNYSRTLSLRIDECDTIFWLKYPLEVCLSGIEERRGKDREDMPWIEVEPDLEFIEFVKNFEEKNVPEIKSLLDSIKGKEIYIFRSRQMSEEYLNSIKNKM